MRRKDRIRRQLRTYLAHGVDAVKNGMDPARARKNLRRRIRRNVPCAGEIRVHLGPPIAQASVRISNGLARPSYVIAEIYI